MKALTTKPRTPRPVKAPRAVQLLIAGEWLISADRRLGAVFVNDGILVAPLGSGGKTAINESAIVGIDEFPADYGDVSWRPL